MSRIAAGKAPSVRCTSYRPGTNAIGLPGRTPTGPEGTTGWSGDVKRTRMLDGSYEFGSMLNGTAAAGPPALNRLRSSRVSRRGAQKRYVCRWRGRGGMLRFREGAVRARADIWRVRL